MHLELKMKLTGIKNSVWDNSRKGREICGHHCSDIKTLEDNIDRAVLSAGHPNRIDLLNVEDQTFQCKNIDVEDVAEIIGEISGSLNGSNTSVCLDFYSKIEQCLQNCLNPSEASSWFNMSVDLCGNFDKKWNHPEINYENYYERSSICHLIETARSLITHLNQHLIAATVMPSKHLQIQPALESFNHNKHHITFSSRHFILTLLKKDCSNCHNCDVALILLLIFSRYIEILDNNLKESHEYTKAKNNCIDCININNNNNGDDTDNSTIFKVNLRDFTSGQHPILCSIPLQNVQISLNLSKILPGCSSFEDVGFLHSEILPVKEKQTSSDIQTGVCETMPTDMFHRFEEKRMSNVTYGSMNRVLHFIKSATSWRDSTNGNQAVGVVLHKYKKILKIKNDCYDEGVHFIKQTLSPLGSGCFGKCFLATDTDTRSCFCLKMVKLFKSSEVEIWAKLSDIKGIPKFFGVLFYNDYVYILQEFVHGPTLKSNISQSNSGMKLILSLEIFKSLLLILSKLHRKDVVHNDVKADNIILGNGQVFLVDFGLSVKLVNGVTRGNPSGSQCHWSPEKAASEEYGVKSDVWAAMVVFVHMISGTEPWLKRFDGRKALHFIIKTKSPPIEDVPKDIPDVVLDLIMKGWKVDAKIRSNTDELLNHEAFQLIEKFGRQENQRESIELINRSLELKNEDIIMHETYMESQQLLSELPDRFKQLNSNTDYNSSHDNELLHKALEVLEDLSGIPDHMITLSEGLLEELNRFFKDEETRNVEDALSCFKLEDESPTTTSSTGFEMMRSEKEVQPRIPLMVEEQFLSSDEEGGDLDEALVVVLLEDGTKVYSCNLNPYSITRWSDVAERCSTSVHNRSILRFYLILHPSGEKINASENVIDTMRNRHVGSQTQSASSSLQNVKSKSSNEQNKVIHAEVVEIKNEVQKWEWKVENCHFIQLLSQN